MATQAIDATIFASTHPDIAKRTSVSGLIFSVAMLLLGVLVFASTFEITDRSSTLSVVDGLGHCIFPFRNLSFVLEI